MARAVICMVLRLLQGYGTSNETHGGKSNRSKHLFTKETVL